MSFIATKCSVMYVLPSSRKQLSRLLTYSRAYSGIRRGHIDVTSNSHLNWGWHISNVVSRGNSTLGFLRRNFKEYTIPVNAATYTTTVRPAMEYSSSVWDPHHQRQIKALDQVQHKAARYICNNYTDRSPGCVTNDLQWGNLRV